MGTKASRAKQTSPNANTGIPPEKDPSFRLQWVPSHKLWHFSDEHLNAVESTGNFPKAVMQIIIIFLPQKWYYIEPAADTNIDASAEPTCLCYLRCIDNEVDPLRELQYTPPSDYPSLSVDRLHALRDANGALKFKVGILGAARSGKTCLATLAGWGVNLVQNSSEPASDHPYELAMTLQKTHRFEIEIVDILSAETMYAPHGTLRNVDGMIQCMNMLVICFHATKRESLQELVAKIREWTKNGQDESFGIVLCGTQIDKRADRDDDEDKLALSMTEIMQKVEELQLPYIEISSKNEWNIHYLFSYCIYEYVWQTAGK